MKIMKLTANLLLPVKANLIEGKNNKKYFNIRHGSSSNGLFFYTIFMDAKHFKPNENEDEILLKDNDYILKAIFKDKHHIKDKKENFLYTLSVDDVEEHKKDYLILWEIPNKFYKDVKYEIDGNVAIVGEGLMGRLRNDILYKSPAPVLEIYGNCTLNWSAFKDDYIYKQTITFKDDIFNIGLIVKEKVPNNECDNRN